VSEFQADLVWRDSTGVPVETPNINFAHLDILTYWRGSKRNNRGVLDAVPRGEGSDLIEVWPRNLAACQLIFDVSNRKLIAEDEVGLQQSTYGARKPFALLRDLPRRPKVAPQQHANAFLDGFRCAI